ncbi:MAG: hypothetical protein AVDCRST_MAG85-1738 [uncultured Solirubrobacteraceae bacterium]|uniref:N-acetyltransferase domain-containing protein n=1 Tax=uncultured Solirubrobacteraceae bacterium TaxID=1162706 RepID=A0A6J4SPH4_9ACTN|nr:MAG: hypothetical protein AVDCRST_MAG85-1738 [uncultured Solirubrobacteraceae bacterium]
MTLRRATSADVGRVTELVNDAYGHYVARIGGPPRPMTDDYADVVSRLDVTVAERDGRIVGLVVLDPRDDDGFCVDNVAADPAHQGGGVGRALLEHAEAAARDAGSDAIVLYTHERMTENRALYARIGYVEYDRRHYGNGVVVRLRKELGPAADPT